jgi:hypothetical protein
MVRREIILMNASLSFKSSYVIFLFAALLAAFSQMAWAQVVPGTYTVCLPEVGACDYPSPVLAVNDPDRVDGDVIDITTDTYLIGGTLQVNYNVTIKGNGSVFDANGIRAINVNTPSGNLNLSNITIKNSQAGSGFGGGAIWVWNGARLTVNGGIFENNQAEFGGAIQNSGAYVEINQSVFSGNRAYSGKGGAILTDNGGETLLQWVEIDGNEATLVGGGLAVVGTNSQLTLRASTVSNNLLTDEIGPTNDVSNDFSFGCGATATGVSAQSFIAELSLLSAYEFEIQFGGNPSPAGTSFTGRVLDSLGTTIGTSTAVSPSGAVGSTIWLRYTMDAPTNPIALTPGELYILEVDMPSSPEFSIRGSLDNPYTAGQAANCGFGFSPDLDFDFKVIGALSNGNGAGIYAQADSTVHLDTSTVSGNLGGGIMVEDSTLESTFSTIGWNWGNGFTSISNDAVAGGTFSGTIIADNAVNDCESSNVISLGYNLIGDGTGCSITPVTGDQIGTITSAGPINAILAPLQNNGGPTSTQALGPASPAVDSAGTGCSDSVDQRGVTRPLGIACDIGAFELVPPLQHMIDTADPGDVLIVPDSIYQERITIGDGITLRGSGPDNVVIDASALSIPGSVITATGDFALEGITVTGGDSPDNGGGINASVDDIDIVLSDVVFDSNDALANGGAIYIRNGSLDLDNVRFTGNSAAVGGAIYSYLPNKAGEIINGFTETIDVALRNVVFNGNAAVSSGGAMYMEVGKLEGTQVTFTNNSAAEGGALHNVNSWIEFAESGFSGNVANIGTGSAILTDNGGLDPIAGHTYGGSTILWDSTVDNNQSLLSGSTIAAIGFRSQLNLVRSTVSNNYASTPPFSAVFVFQGGDLFMDASTVSGNAGSGIEISTRGWNGSRSVLQAHFSTITDNERGFAGLDGSHVDFEHSIIAGNGNDGVCLDLFTSSGFNLIGDNSDCDFTPSIGDLVGNSSSPIDPLLGPLEDNGGPTLTHALLPGSPAIDAAGSGPAEGCYVTVDQRYTPRPTGFACDMGAYEAVIPLAMGPVVLSATNLGQHELSNNTYPGVVDVPIIDIPIEKLTGGTLSAPESAPLGSFPLGSFPIGSFDLQNSPIGSFPLGSFPIGSFPIGSFPLGSFPLSSIPLLSEGGWSNILAGTELEGAPPQTITLEQVLRLDPLPGAVKGIKLRDLAIQGSPLASLSLQGLALGATTVVDIDQWLADAGRTDTVCATLFPEEAPNISSCSGTDTLLGLEMKGAPVSALSLSSLPLGSFPIGSFPLGSFPIGSFPLGSFPIGSFPIGSFPIGSFPIGSFPIGSFPIGSFPIGSFPIGSFPIGSFPIGSFPLGSFEIDGKSFCEFYDEQAIADSALSCSDLGIDNANWLVELVTALQTAGASDIGSTPLGSFPLGSFPIGSFPIGSFPIGSFPIGSFPIGSFLIDSFPIGSFPIGSFPIGSFSFGAVPLGSFEIGGKSFCEFYDEQALAGGAASCSDLGITNANWLADLIAALHNAGASDIGSTPLGSFPMGSFPIGSFPIGSFGIADLQMSLVDIDVFEINGVPLGSFPLGSFDLIGSPLGSFPIGSFTAVIDGDCAGCRTLADAARAGVISTTAILADLAGSAEFDNLTLGEVLDAMTLAMIYGRGTLADIKNTGNLTLGQLLIAMMLKTDFPWETIPLDQLDVQEFSADHFVGYAVDLQLTGTVLQELTVAVTLSDQFMYVQGSSLLDVSGMRLTYPTVSLPDPAIVKNVDGTQTLSFVLDLGGYTDNTIRFTTVPALALGNYEASAEVTLAGFDPVTASDGGSGMTVVPHWSTDIDDPDDLPTSPADVLLLGFIDTPDDIDYFMVDAPAAGNRVAVFMANPASDNDLVMYEPLSTVEAKGQTAEASALDSVPFEDDGIRYQNNLTEEPNALEDVNLRGEPLASISTNRAYADEAVSAIAGDTAPFTIQVSGYNGATSDDPYILRVKVTPEVTYPECTPRSWPSNGASSTVVPAGEWMSDTNAVFLVNGARLAASEGSDSAAADAADAALTAINNLIHAPGITNGVVVDVSGIYGVNDSYDSWDANPCDVDAPNAIVNAITGYLEEMRAGSPNLAYVTIVGSDEVIPFARKPDETSISNESTFAGEFADNAMYGALVTRHFLSDDSYGDIDPIAWLDRYLNVPELGVGRLVETAADIRTAAENYLAFAGVLDPQTALSAGYDFIADAAQDIDDTFNAYGPILGFSVEPALIDQPETDALNAWTRSDFLSATGLNTPHPVEQVSFNMHFDFDEALPSSGDAAGNYTDNLINTTDLGTRDLAGGIWFTVGCHSGTNVPDISVVAGAPGEDWAQSFSRLGALYLAQNAFGLGDTEAIALSERLMANFARNLNGSLTTGQAHAFAKQQYFADLGLYGEYDFKALQASTLFGLPMYKYGSGAVVANPLPPALPVTTDPISGLSSTSWSLSDTGIGEPRHTSKGDLFSADGEVQFVHFRPLQPIVRRDVTGPDGKTASGAFLTSLVTEDYTVEDIAFARPVIDLGENEPEIETDEVVFPTAFTNIANFKAPSSSGGAFEPRQKLNVIVGQFTSLPGGGSSGTERLFRSFDTQVFYRTAPTTSTALVPVADDFVRPEFDNVQASVVGSQQAVFSVDVTDENTVLRVAVLYLQSVTGGKGNWVLADLVKGSGNTWTGGGTVDLSGITDGQVDYMLQAVDSNGNVANSTFKGLFYVAEQLPSAPAPDNGSGTIGVRLWVGEDEVDPNDWITDEVVVEITNKAPETSYEYSVDLKPFVALTEAGFLITEDGLHIVTVRESDGSNPVTFVVLIDKTPPTVVITRPAAGDYIVQGQGTAARYQCLDAGSGIASCDGPVYDGDPIPSVVIGTNTFQVTAQDYAGNDPTVAANEYFVVQQLEIAGPEAPVSIGTVIDITATATDLDGIDEQMTIDWGDGTIETSNLPTGNPVSVFTASHLYQQTGVYPITLTIEDGNGALIQSGVFEFAVIFDPKGGFVTGGGWINSPSGAYTPGDSGDPDVVGKANFGLISKYQKGQSVPDGSTNFRFAAGNLVFDATVYEWMIISGANVRYKGEGTVKGGGDLYKFMVTALDADIAGSGITQDGFRIKIWQEDPDGAEIVLYDNGLGVDESTGSGGTTPLGGGSITIHKDSKK